MAAAAIDTSLAVLLGMVIGGALAWYGRELLDLLRRLLEKKAKPESGVVHPPSPQAVPKGATILGGHSGVVRPPSPKLVAREEAERSK